MKEYTYTVERQYEGLYYVLDDEDGERVASVGRFMPGPMVSVDGPRIVSPAMARAVADAMVALADDLERDTLRQEYEDLMKQDRRMEAQSVLAKRDAILLDNDHELGRRDA